MTGTNCEALGLGKSFEVATEVAAQAFEQAPFLYAEVITGVRRALLPRFPYGVFYAIRSDLVHVLAAIHNARNTRRWPRVQGESALIQGL